MKPFDLHIPKITHAFESKPVEARDDYRCAVCDQPRCLHLEDGHQPNREPSRIPEDGCYRMFQKPIGL